VIRILLTGAHGFLGRHIFKELSLQGFELDTLGKRDEDSIICDLSFGAPKIDVAYDYVLHCAGKAHAVAGIIGEEKEFFEVNVRGTKNLLEGLTKSGVPKHFVFISSVSVYGLDFGNEIDENVHLGALDPYGISKIEAEQIVSAWCQQNHVVCTILRLPLIVGSDPPGNLKAMIKGIEKGYYFNVDGGNAKKSMVLAEDIAKAILKIAEIGGVYNLTDGYHPKFAELADYISIQLGKGKLMNMPMWMACIIAFIGDIIGRKAPLNSKKLMKITSDLTFNDTKARVAFGWSPTPVLKGFKIAQC
jgi:nucleoside-diphosphate-sugar epimerase